MLFLSKQFLLQKGPKMKEAEVKIIGPLKHSNSGITFMLLKEKGGNRFCSISIDTLMVSYIFAERFPESSKRPLTHDVMLKLMDNYHLNLEKVVITKYNKEIDSYYASIFIKNVNDIITEDNDTRPSDAVALALRKKCPIFINEELLERDDNFLNMIEKLEKSRSDNSSIDPLKMSEEELSDWFKNLDPKDIKHE